MDFAHLLPTEFPKVPRNLTAICEGFLMGRPSGVEVIPYGCFDPFSIFVIVVPISL